MEKLVPLIHYIPSASWDSRRFRVILYAHFYSTDWGKKDEENKQREEMMKKKKYFETIPIIYLLLLVSFCS